MRRIAADQLLAAVADARVAEMAEAGEVLADLGVGEAQQPAELAGADRRLAVPHQVLQLAQVEAQPVDHRLGDVVRIGLCQLVFARVHAEPAAAGDWE